MSLDAGGHLTHGFRPNISGKMFHQRSYGTDPATGLLDYDALRAKAREFKPLVLIAGYSAYPRRVNFAKMREIADEVGATLMVDMAHFAGLVAGKVFTGDFDPVPYAHIVTTTTHKSLRGPRGGLVLCQPEYADAVDRGCPMVLGGPLAHVMAAKAVALAEARQPSFATYAQDIADNAVPRRRADAPRRPPGHRRHRQPPRAARRVVVRAHRPPGRVRPARRRHRHQPQRDPARPERRLVHLRHPDRHPGADHPRGFGAAEFDRVAELIVDVLTSTSPNAAASGGASKAKYTIADGVADKTHSAANELLDAHPLYPGLELT